MPQSWIRYPVFYLLVTAAAGVVLRGMAFLPSWQHRYEPLLHAHSHIALLGWGYGALVLLLVSRFVEPERQRSRFLRIHWLLVQITIIGMFIAFSLQGYGLFSIALSTLHILLSYSFAIWMWRRLKRGQENRISVKFARASLFFMALSSLGPWSLAYLSANHLTDSPLYHAAIYFYLHCQYNGWFTLGLFAIFYSILEKSNIPLSKRLSQLHYRLYTLPLLPAFLLSVLWMDLSVGLYASAVLSGILQVVAVAAFFILWFRVVKAYRTRLFTGWTHALLLLSLTALAVKMVLELGAAIPALEPLVYSTRSVIIGYLHLVLLGFVSCMLLAFLLQSGWIVSDGRMFSNGCSLFIGGFIGNELLLFMSGLLHWIQIGGIPYERELLLAVSMLMLAGLGSIGTGCAFTIKKKQTSISTMV